MFSTVLTAKSSIVPLLRSRLPICPSGVRPCATRGIHNCCARNYEIARESPVLSPTRAPTTISLPFPLLLRGGLATIRSFSKASNQGSIEDQNRKPLDAWEANETLQWIKAIENGYFRDVAEKFAIPGSVISTMEKDDFLRRSSEKGDLIFHAIKSVKPLKKEPKISPKQLYEAILNFKDSDLKEDFKKPNILCKFKHPRQGRDESLKQVYTALLERSHVPTEEIDERFNNPLISPYGPPGSGKSYFLDELAKLKEEDLKTLVTDDQDRKFLQEMVPVTISFNGKTPFSELETSQLAFLPRMLHSFFFWGHSGYGDFAQSFGSELTSDLVIKTILHAIEVNYERPRPILLLVDECLKVKNVEFMLREIGALLDRYPSSKFNAVLSTLDPDPFFKLKTLSGRKIKWVLLPRLDREESEKFFGGIPLPPALRQCISDCNGHPRSLEYLLRTWKVIGIDPQIGTADPNYTDLLTRFSEKLEEGMPHLGTDFRELVPVALRGKQLNEDTKVGRLTLGQYRAMGYLTNTQATDSFVPTLSPVLLYIYARKNWENPGKDGILAQLLMDLIQKSTNHHYKPNERFHALWECLRRYLLSMEGEEWTTLEKFYELSASDGDTFFSETGTFNRNFRLLDKKVKEFEYSWPAQGKNHKRAVEILEEKEKSDFIFLPSEHNAAIDAFTFEKDDECQSLVIAFENKFSSANAKTNSELPGIVKKRTLFNHHLRLLQASFPSVAVPIQDSYFVYAAMHPVLPSTNAALPAKLEELPSNTIVLGKKKLLQLYSPSLACRPQFLLLATETRQTTAESNRDEPKDAEELCDSEQ